MLLYVIATLFTSGTNNSNWWSTTLGKTLCERDIKRNFQDAIQLLNYGNLSNFYSWDNFFFFYWLRLNAICQRFASNPWLQLKNKNTHKVNNYSDNC